MTDDARARRLHKSLLFCHAVTDAWFGEREARVARVIAKLLAQLANVDSQVLAVVNMRRAPDGRQDHFLRHKAPAMACHHPQKVEFSTRLVQGPAFQHGCMG
jgi:hypothetical protein